MKILFLTQVLPYPMTGGAKIRAYYVLRQLSQHHEITLASFVRPDDSEADLAHLASICKAVHTVPMVRSKWKSLVAFLESLASGEPAVIVRDRVQAMLSTLSAIVGRDQFAAIHADQTSMAQYALFAQSQYGEEHRLHTVLDQHNALYRLVERQSAHERWPMRKVWQREARQLAVYERELCQRFDRILTVTQEDKQSLLALLPESEAEYIEGRVTPVPICVDPGSQGLLRRKPVGHQIVHLGTMFWPPNAEGVRWFAKQVLPLVWQEVPDAVFVIAGKNPLGEVRALSKVRSAGTGKVIVTGFVKDPVPLLEQSRVFVVPLRSGGGMRVKIVNAWLWGVPIVSTRVGAEGLAVKPGENILIADEPAAFASAVVQLMEHPSLSERMRAAGRAWVEERYDYRKVYGQIETLYREMHELNELH